MAQTRIRHFAGKIRDRLNGKRRHWILTRALRKLSSLPAGTEPPDDLLRRLEHGWNNEAWSASTTYLRAAIRYFNLTRGTVVECGSGLSTLVLGTLAKRDQRRVLAFEHHAEWAKRVRDEAEAHSLGSVQLALTGLRSYGDFDWYNIDSVALPEEIGLVLCDGPPAQTRGGRYGAIPVLVNAFAPGCVVLLDDTGRLAEQQIAGRWCNEFGMQTLDNGGTFTALRAGSAEDGFHVRRAS